MSDTQAGLEAIRARSLKANLLYALLGTGLFNLCRFAVVVLMVKCASTEMSAIINGHFSYCLSISSPIVLFFALNLRAVLVADAHNIVPFGNYLRVRTLGMAAAAVVLAGVVVWDGLTKPQPNAAYLLMLIFVCISKLIESEAEIYWGLYQKDERMDLVATSNALRGLAMLVPFAIGPPLAWHLWLRGLISEDQLIYGSTWACAAFTLGWLAVALLFDRRQARRRTLHRPDWSWPAVWALVIRAFPLGIVVLLLSLTTSIPRLVIEAQPEGKKALGFFAPMTYVVQVGTLLIVQFGYTASNRLAIYFRDNVRAFIRLFFKLEAVALALGLGTLVVTLVAGRWILKAFFKPEYASHYWEFQVLVVGQCVLFVNSLLGFTVTQMQLYWVQVAVTSLTAAGATVTALLVVPRDPIAGGAYAALVSALVQLAALTGCLVYGLKNREKILAAGRSTEPLPPG